MNDLAQAFAYETAAIANQRAAEARAAGKLSCCGCHALDYGIDVCREMRGEGICKLVLLKRWLDLQEKG